jgi:hypothetical protein
MTDHERPDDPALKLTLWRLYRRFFDQDERRRRWSIERDIPWAKCNRGLDPVIADVVESYCVVELFFPIISAMPCPGHDPAGPSPGFTPTVDTKSPSTRWPWPNYRKSLRSPSPFSHQYNNENSMRMEASVDLDRRLVFLMLRRGAQGPVIGLSNPILPPTYRLHAAVRETTP